MRYRYHLTHQAICLVDTYLVFQHSSHISMIEKLRKLLISMFTIQFQIRCVKGQSVNPYNLHHKYYPECHTHSIISLTTQRVSHSLIIYTYKASTNISLIRTFPGIQEIVFRLQQHKQKMLKFNNNNLPKNMYLPLFFSFFKAAAVFIFS